MVRCIVCRLVFCCADCRWRHEKIAHNLAYDCPICRGYQFLCKPQQLNPDFIEHLTKEHTPLHCKKCNKVFENMEDFLNIDKCTSISELIGQENEVGNSQMEKLDEKFESIYEKVNKYGENIEGIIAVNKNTKTAVITPIVRKKNIVDYESSGSEDEVKIELTTPHPKIVSKTPKLRRQRTATPHTKKLLTLMKQKVVEEYEETIGDEFDGSPANKLTPVRIENNEDLEQEMTTPTSHLPHLIKLAQIVTTSTPTHAACNGWPLFADQGADSPLSEIETTESAAQSMNIEPSKSDSDAVPPKLKSIIVTGSKNRIGSQDSTEKHVTFQDSQEGSIKTKKVKFAEDTVFEQPKVKRVFRKPKRMLTPGPQKPRYCYNPRFQALINRFENQGIIMARTPKTREKNTNNQENTPPVGEPSTMQARAINFKEDSPQIESEQSKESNELFKTCIDTPEVGMNAISTLTTNIAGTLQNCLSSVLMNTVEETEIQFKFVITKRKVSVKRLVEECEGKLNEELHGIDKNQDSIKDNIWSSVAKAVKNVFWGEQTPNIVPTTPHRSFSFNSSSSSSKRKCDELSDTESPLNHKRHKYEGRIRGRPPLRSKTSVASLRSTMSAEQKSLFNDLTTNVDENMNLSF
ncbi:hypothetical protein HW555_006156 [Spodoptera exigua]|uniref:Uncharacterized protein n=1 Tax=Spodoptera exigua TaxID=7107 RepID=A0A835GIQ4_SPOEX|nr:hypothetical protein HW555_006156 [Spodoptera exigua]